MSTAVGRALEIFKKSCKNFKIQMNTFNTQLDTFTTAEATRKIVRLSGEKWDKILLGLNELKDQHLEVQELEEVDALYEELI